MELTVKCRNSQLLIRNAFNSMNELCIARTQWNNRVNTATIVDQFIKERSTNCYFYGIVFSKENLSIAKVNNSGAFENVHQMYSQNQIPDHFSFTSIANDAVSFLSQYFQSSGDIKHNHICLMDYDTPLKVNRSSLTDILNLAEGMGVIKSKLLQFDPSFQCVNCRDVLKFMHIDYKQSDPIVSILEYGKLMWAKQLSPPQLQVSTTRDINKAQSYLYARYAFARSTVDSILAGCNDHSHSYIQQYYHNVIKTYIARYYMSLAEKYDVLDITKLPNEINDKVNHVMYQWIVDSVFDYQNE